MHKDLQEITDSSPPGSEVPRDEDPGLLFFLKVMFEHKILILGTTIIATAIALLYAFLATPIYRADVLLAPVTQDKGGRFGALANQFGGLASLVGVDLGGGDGSVEEAIATLKSRDLTMQFIKEENILQVLFKKNWDSQDKKWIKKPPSLWDAYLIFNGSIRTVKRDKNSGLVTMSIDWKDPEMAARWVMRLVDMVNEKSREDAIMATEKNMAYLENELGKTSNIEIKQSIYKLIEAQAKNRMLASTRKEYAFRVVDKAVVPETRIKPKRSLVVILGFISGFMLGVIGSFIKRSRLCS